MGFCNSLCEFAEDLKLCILQFTVWVCRRSEAVHFCNLLCGFAEDLKLWVFAIHCVSLQKI